MFRIQNRRSLPVTAPTMTRKKRFADFSGVGLS